MACNCGKPEGTCGCNKDCHASPAVLQINNPAEYATFHKVDVPVAFGDDTEYQARNGMYRNVILHYEKNDAVYIYSSDGIPVKISSSTMNRPITIESEPASNLDSAISLVNEIAEALMSCGIIKRS